MSSKEPKPTESTKNEPVNSSVYDTPIAVKMLSNLCNIRMKVRGLSEKVSLKMVVKTSWFLGCYFKIFQNRCESWWMPQTLG